MAHGKSRIAGYFVTTCARGGGDQCWLLLLLLLISLIHDSQQGPAEERLINDIFKRRDYNKLARPVAKESQALNVQFGISLQQIIEVNMKNEMLQTSIWLDYVWSDYNLGWNESEYEGIQSIRLPSHMIWTPDILMYNSADEKIDNKYPTNIQVFSNGVCHWLPLGLYISACPLDITWFPFDDQHCPLKFGSWTYDGTKVNLTMQADKADTGTYSESGEWLLIETPMRRKVEVYACCAEPYIDITLTIHIRRRTLFYGFNLILPVVLLNFLSLFTFALPPDAGEKVALGITILLSLSVFSLIVADMVPPTSLAVCVVGVYFAAMMIMCTVSVIMTVLVLNFHHRNPAMYNMSPWVKRLICERLAWILRMSRPGHTLTLKSMSERSTLRELEEKNPASQSLISNVRDVDNGIPLNDLPPNRGTGDSGIPLSSCRHELLAILHELRYMTRKKKEEDEAGAEMNDWKFAAMVIDRLCQWLLSTYFIITSLCIFLMMYAKV